jgi:hypothetical protein
MRPVLALGLLISLCAFAGESLRRAITPFRRAWGHRRNEAEARWCT